MNQSMMRKNLLQTIKYSLGRYIAIIAIIALGAGIFVGLLSTKDDMVATGQKYTDSQNMFDLRLLSTYGWTQADVDEILKMEGIVSAEGSITMDVYGRGHGAQEDGVYRLHAVPETVSKVYLLSGRMPQNPDECLVDGFAADDSILGTTFVISDANDSDTLDALKYKKFTVVGYVSTPLYMDMTRGTTTLGSGSLSSYVYIPKDAFDTDYYTEIGVTVEGDHTIYSHVYDDLLETMADRIEPNLLPLAQQRYQDLLDEAEDAYADGMKQYEDGLAEFLDAKKEAYEQLEEAYQQLLDAQAEIDSNKITLEDGQKQLDDGQALLNEQLAALNQSKVELLAAKAEAYSQLAAANTELLENYRQVSSALTQVESGIAQIDSGLEQLDSGILQLEDGLQQLADGLEQLDMLIGILDISIEIAESAAGLLPEGSDAQSNLEELKATRDEYVAQRDQLLIDQETYTKQLEDLYVQRDEINAQRTELVATKETLDSAMVTIEDGMVQLQSNQIQVDNQFASAEAQIESGEVQIVAAQTELDVKRLELEAGKLALEEGEAALVEGWAEYEKGKAEADAEFAKAQEDLDEALAELSDARRTIDEMAAPDVYILDRNTNSGYTSLESNSDIMAAISRVFPAFFLAVAALVCITTMTRMVDEERTQIGIMKAMGYGNWAIISKYIYYAGSAALLGCGFGVLAGSVVFPMILWNAFCIMLNITPWVVLKLNIPLCLAVVLAYTAVMLLVTWYCCRRELKEVPAELIRPKPPTSGKKILLEYLPFWNKISFLNKVMLRNVFRYRQRLLMMLLGIGGCTALLVTGFGIKDSVTTVVDYQYAEVTTYDMEVYFDGGLTEEEQALIREELRSDVDQIGFFHQSSVEIDFNNRTKELLLKASDESIKNYIDFHAGSQQLDMPGLNEAYITVGVAENMGISVGDTVTVRNADMQSLELTVTGIFDNHVSNYLIVLPETLQNQWGGDVEYQMAFVTIRDYQDAHETAAAISGMDGVMNVSVSQDMADMVGSMMDALILVVVTVVICAGLLAVIVLYNLTNINITERLREIATIKVLGFTSGETSAYVFKENILLSVMGAVFGLFFGNWLLNFVISQIKIDMVWFAARTTVLSYILSIVLTLLSALIVDFVFHFKLEKINMAEALKSVE